MTTPGRRLQDAANKCTTQNLRLRKIIFAWEELSYDDKMRLEKAADSFWGIKGLGGVGILELLAALGVWMIESDETKTKRSLA